MNNYAKGLELRKGGNKSSDIHERRIYAPRKTMENTRDEEKTKERASKSMQRSTKREHMK